MAAAKSKAAVKSSFFSFRRRDEAIIMLNMLKMGRTAVVRIESEVESPKVSVI